MTADPDILVVTLGAPGLSGWRRGSRPGSPDGRLDVPGATLSWGKGSSGGPDAPGQASRLLAAVAPLLDQEAAPPEVAVWVLPARAGFAEAAAVEELSATLDQLHAQVGSRVTLLLSQSVAALVGGQGSVTPGVVLAVGSHVVTLATDFDQVWTQVDGWGSWGIAERGSGAWIGAQGLAAALRARDGVPGGSTALLHAARARLGPEGGWAPAVDGPQGAAVLTGFAAVLGEVAQDDPAAAEICRMAGEHLADSVEAARRSLPDAQVCAVGGLLFVDAVRVALASALGRRLIFLVPAMGGVMDGARLLADHVAAAEPLAHRPPLLWRSDRGRIG